MRLAIAVNHTDCHLKWQNSNRDAKVIGGQSKDSLSTRVITWTRLIVMFTIEPKMGLYFEHISINTHLFGVRSQLQVSPYTTQKLVQRRVTTYGPHTLIQESA